MNVVKGASGGVCGVLFAFSEAFLSIATSCAVRTVVHMIAGFGQNCIRTRGRTGVWPTQSPQAVVEGSENPFAGWAKNSASQQRNTRAGEGGKMKLELR